MTLKNPRLFRLKVIEAMTGTPGAAECAASSATRAAGATEAVVDGIGLPLLTEALLADGFTPAQIKAMMGENAMRVFRQTLPP